jgi:hypothetical protein
MAGAATASADIQQPCSSCFETPIRPVRGEGTASRSPSPRGRRRADLYGLQPCNDSIERLPHFPVGRQRAVTGPRGGDDQPIDAPIAVVVIGCQKDVFLPARTGGPSVGLVTREKAVYATITIARQRHQRTSCCVHQRRAIGEVDVASPSRP